MHGLIVYNAVGQINNFCRQDGRSSNIDVTMTIVDIGGISEGWVVNDFTDCVQRVISYNLVVKRPPSRNPGQVRYNTKTTDWDLFRTTLLGEVGSIPSGDINSTAENISCKLTIAAECSMTRKKSDGQPCNNLWWSPILWTLRQTLVRKIRKGLRTTDHRKYYWELMTEIRNHKAAAWKSFTGDLNENPWSSDFKWAKNGSRLCLIPSTLTKANGSQTSTCRETAELILKKFVPSNLN